jgi:hypothetical protein
MGPMRIQLRHQLYLSGRSTRLRRIWLVSMGSDDPPLRPAGSLRSPTRMAGAAFSGEGQFVASTTRSDVVDGTACR